MPASFCVDFSDDLTSEEMQYLKGMLPELARTMIRARSSRREELARERVLRSWFGKRLRQDTESVLMHRAAIRLVSLNPSLVPRLQTTLERWIARSGTQGTLPLRR